MCVTFAHVGCIAVGKFSRAIHEVILNGCTCRLVRLGWGGVQRSMLAHHALAWAYRIDGGSTSRALQGEGPEDPQSGLGRESLGRRKRYQSRWELPLEPREGTQQLRAPTVLGKDPLLLAHSHLQLQL